jgi:hypothetical protein
MARGKTRRSGGMIRYSAFLRRDQLEALRTIQDQTDVTVSLQIRRALDTVLGLKPAAPRGRR